MIEIEIPNPVPAGRCALQFFPEVHIEYIIYDLFGGFFNMHDGKTKAEQAG